MTAARSKYVVQLGRSTPYSLGRPKAEFVHIELPESRDISVYLNDPACEFSNPNFNIFEISVGNGGTSWVRTIQASNRGSCLHFMASQLIVRAEVTPSGSAIVPAVNPRMMAAAAFGRPTTNTIVRTIDGSPIAAGASMDIDLSPFCVAVQVFVTRDVDTDPIASANNATVAEQIVVVDSTGVPNVVGGTTPTPLSQWQTPHPIEVFTNNLLITNTNPALGPALRVAIAETIVH